MKKVGVEIYSNETNSTIVRLQGRKFPGVVIQGDNLSNLYHLSKSIYERADAGPDTELKSEAQTLFKILDATIRNYESVLDAHGISIPYFPDVVLKDILDWQQKHDE